MSELWPMGLLFFFCYKNVDMFFFSFCFFFMKPVLWYSLEEAHQDTSDKYHNICFCEEIKKYLPNASS